MVRTALRARRRKPIFVLDVAIPGDADPAIAELEDAFLYDLDHLEAIARSNRESRDAALQAAWQLVDSHVDAFRAMQAERDAVPVVAELRAHFEAMRDEILASAPQADADDVTRRLINRLLHTPSGALRDAARDGGAGNAVAEAARRMFGLKPDANRKTKPGEPGSEDE